MWAKGEICTCYEVPKYIKTNRQPIRNRRSAVLVYSGYVGY